MAKCDYCGTTILFGGKTDGDLRFCNDTCYRQGVLVGLSKQVPEEIVHKHVWNIHQGRCPKCGGDGPVDVHMSHRVWSLVLLTSWRSTPQVSCRSCGVKSQVGNTLFSLVLGWWGIPFGLVMTPVQVGRNIVDMFKGPDPAKPSARLETVVRMTIAERAVAAAQAEQANQKAA